MKVLALGNLFPSPWDPRRSMFNRQQFEHLGRLCELHVVGAVDFRQRFRPAGTVAPFQHLQARWFTFWHLPRIGREWQAAMLADCVAGAARALDPEQNFDCLLASWAYPDAVAVAALARRLDLPWVAKVHGSDINGLPAAGRRRRRVAQALAEADAVVAVSEALADGVRQLGVPEADVHVLYNGVDRQAFCPGSRSRACAALGLDERRPTYPLRGQSQGQQGLPRSAGCASRSAGIGAGDPAGDGGRRARSCRHQAAYRCSRARCRCESARRRGAPAASRLVSCIRPALPAESCRRRAQRRAGSHGQRFAGRGNPVWAAFPRCCRTMRVCWFRLGDRAALGSALQQGLARTWDTARIVGHASRFDWSQNAERLFGILKDAVASRTG